jgi:Ca2+-binding EF-hand superfamily protein
MENLLMVKDFTGDGEINEEEFYRIMKKTSLF